MTTDKADLILEAKQKGLQEALKTIKLLRQEAATTQQVFASYSKSFDAISKSIAKSRLEAQQFFRDLGKYSKGTFGAQLINAEASRSLANLKAQFRDVGAEQVNLQMKTLRDTVKGFENANIIKKLGLDKASGPVQNAGELAKKLREVNSLQKASVGFTKDFGNAVAANNSVVAKAMKMEEAQFKARERAAAKAQADALRAQKIAMNFKTPQQKAAESRAFAVERVTGDGGASLFKIQASLLVNYMLMNQLFNLFQFGTQFVLQLDKAFADLQATIAATDGQMVGLKQSIIDVSQGTKFTAVEVAEAALILGQAGLSVNQIKESISGVTLLATATASDLKTSVDVATSAISIFNLRAEDMGHVANVITGAINETKLTMDKLALGFQYAGNIAAEAGLSFEETTAILGGLANAGIRSGSTLGTGLRQLLTEFINPSEKFSKALEKVGLELEDVDVKSKGFVGVLNNLKEAGFTASDAFESLDLRAAAAFAAIQNDPEIINRLQQSFIYTTAAAKANEVQMKSLANTFSQFKGALGTFVNSGSGPVVDTLQIITKTMSEMLIVGTRLGPVMDVAGSAVAAFGVAVVSVKLTQFIKNLIIAETAAKGLGLAFGTAAAGGGALGFSKIMAGLLTPIGKITLGLTALIAAFELFGRYIPDAMDKLDEARTSFANAKGEVDKTAESMTSIDESIGRLIERFGVLKDSPESVRTEFLSLQARFGSLGFKIENETNPSIFGLIDALRALRKELADVSAAQIAAALTEKALLIQREAEVARQKTKQNAQNKGTFSLFGTQMVNPIAPPNYYTDSSVVKSKAASNTASSFANKLSGVDLNDVDAAELKKLQNEATTVLSVLRDQQSSMTRALTKLRASAAQGNKVNQKAMDKYQERLDATNSDIEQVSGLMAGLLDLQNQQTDQLKATFERTDLYQSYTERIEEFQTAVADLREQLAEESDPKKKAEIQTAIKALIDGLDDDLASIMKAKIGGAINFLAEELGPEVGTAEIIKLGEDLKGEAAGPIHEAKEKLASSVGQTIDAATAAIDEASNLVTEQKEIFETIDDVYENQMKRLDFISREASDLERGGLRGKYTDAELSIFEDRKKGIQAQAIKAKIDQGPALLASIDKLISAQQAKVGKTGFISGVQGIPDNRIATSKAEKDLLATMRERSKIMADLNLLQEEYNALTGVATEANISLAQQIKYVLAGYGEQMAIQSQVGYNIKENIVGSLNDARDSFGTFLADVLSGTKSISASFKEMAINILRSMLETQTNKFASGLLGSVATWAAGLFGDGGQAAATTAAARGALNPSLYGPGFNEGGYVHRFAGGGANNRDSVKALLRPGEYVLRNQAVDMIGRDNLDQINAMGARTISKTAVPQMSGQQGGSDTNVWIVSPDQKPSGLGPKDVVAIISEDIIKGGSVKKLIKSVNNGA